MLTGPHPAVLWPCLSATIPGPFCACKPFQEGSPSISIIYVFWASQWLSGKESACQCRKHRFDPWVRKIPWRREWQSIPVFLSGKSHGQKSLAGHSPWGCKRVRNDLATKYQVINVFCMEVSRDICVDVPQGTREANTVLMSSLTRIQV